MKPFSESMRYEYPLTPDSLVIDAGSHEGNFANILREKYDCWILCFEPIAEYVRKTEETLAHHDKILVFNMGLGGSSRDDQFYWHGSKTGILSTGTKRERVVIRDIAEVLEEFKARFNTDSVALLKLNVENAEYEILERILSAGLANRFEHIQVQWHSDIPNAQSRRDAITEKLSATHESTWGIGAFDSGHENWRRK